MQIDYSTKSYGRNSETAVVLKLFQNDKDLAMPGPRRLGKSFLLDRLVERLPAQGWNTVKVEIAGLADQNAVFRELCAKIDTQRNIGKKSVAFIKQRMTQALSPRTSAGGTWYQPFLSIDHESYFERLLKAMNDDPHRRWALLIDELPIFLKSLHDKGAEGIASAKQFMNLLSRLRSHYPKVRWLITGSIGLEPLAKEGEYMGVLAKFTPYGIEPLNVAQSIDFIQDAAKRGIVMQRTEISTIEAQQIVATVGWRAAYYLEALAEQMAGQVTEDELAAQNNVAQALKKLLQPEQKIRFSTWEEHLHKHYPPKERAQAFAVMGCLASKPVGADVQALLVHIADSNLSEVALKHLLLRLYQEGFIHTDNWDKADAKITFRNPLLRQWWAQYPPNV
jgi:uncharacterized protein